MVPTPVVASGTRLDSAALAAEFATTFPELCVEFRPDRAVDPAPVQLNEALATEMGLDPQWLASPEGTRMLAGDEVAAGTTPVAMGYAGHQFGNYSPRLGDGRAVLLGELTAADGTLRDLHLKGTGRTTWSRGGDGKATIGPMLREYVVSEAMAAMGIPTTRSLAVVTTGETVMRDAPEPGAVLARTAASHIRVGTFEYAVRLGGDDLVRRLADYCIDRHHPGTRDSEDPYLGLLRAVIEAQASLVANWMLVGFIHGVMNTDNMTISGEGIDYGPCAFMDRYDPRTVYSSIDHGGRYAYGNQPAVATWNLARFAETLLGLFDQAPQAAVEAATAELERFEVCFREHWSAGLTHKLGLVAPPTDEDLLGDLIEVFRSESLDWTSTFRSLASGLRGESTAVDRSGSDTGTAPGASAPGGPVEVSGALSAWRRRWLAELDSQGMARAAADAMDLVNPAYIPRNHVLDAALRDATAGSLDRFSELVGVLAEPFVVRDGLEQRFAEPAPPDFEAGFRTFCGT
ncbi:MAG: protein adenylyltransferase SelO [Microthrixaceae bacterium]